MAADNGTVPSASFATIQEQSHRSPSEVKWPSGRGTCVGESDCLGEFTVGEKKEEV